WDIATGDCTKTIKTSLNPKTVLNAIAINSEKQLIIFGQRLALVPELRPVPTMDGDAARPAHPCRLHHRRHDHLYALGGRAPLEG
ncbi:MAG: hypothetical protein AAF360_10725, partial [Pseudomonadota bacterium]